MNGVAAIPRVLVEADGTALAGPELHALTEVRVQQRLSLPALCELTFSATTGSLDGAKRLAPGTGLRLRFAEVDVALFVGQVTAMEHVYTPAGAYEIRVRGYDALHRLRQQQSVTVHEDVTVADLARKMGLSVSAETAGPRWSRLFQHSQTDLDLLVEMASYGGLYLTWQDGVLHLVTLAGSGAAQTVALGQSLLEAQFEVNGGVGIGAMTATGWDPLAVETHSGRATRPRSGNTATAGEGLPAAAGFDLVDVTAPTDAHAEALAQAELDRRAAQAVTLWGIAAGHPALRPGTPLQVRGVDASLAGRYTITEATHLIDARLSYVTEIGTAPPPPLPRAQGSVATLGVVVAVDDAAALGRVRVRLPTYGDVETGWINVLSPAAGSNKGFLSLPDEGDTVLVLLAHSNPAQGVVLGGLYSEPKAPEKRGIDRPGARRYTWYTPDGQRIYLDDRKNVVRLENGAGSYIELAGGDITIAGRAIDFRRT